MSALARKHHWRLAVFTKVMCSPADVRLYADAFHGDYRTCDAWRQDAIARIRDLKPDLVVMTSIADHMDLTQGNDDPNGTWARGWATTAAALRVKGTDRVLLADTPAAKTNVPECLSRYPKDIQQCAQTPAAAAGSDQRARIAEAVRGTGARVVDPTPWFCDRARCPVVVGNTLIYRDDNHITGQYARLLAPLLAEELIGRS